VDPRLENEEKKLIFVSVWFSFCVALFLLNRFNTCMFHTYKIDKQMNNLKDKERERDRKRWANPRVANIRPGGQKWPT